MLLVIQQHIADLLFYSEAMQLLSVSKEASASPQLRSRNTKAAREKEAQHKAVEAEKRLNELIRLEAEATRIARRARRPNCTDSGVTSEKSYYSLGFSVDSDDHFRGHGEAY